MRRTVGFAIYAGVLALAGCGPAITYRFPTGDNPPKPTRQTDQDAKLFRENYNLFAQNLAHWADSQPDTELIPILSSYQTGLIFLTAAETKGYENAANFLRTNEPDDYSLTVGFGALPNSTKTLARSSLWMIIPVKLESRFIKDSAENLNADVIRLGSTGLTAQRAVNKWVASFDPPIEIRAPKLDRARPVVSLGGMSITFQPATDSFQSGEGWWRIAGQQDLTLLIWNADSPMPSISKPTGQAPIGEAKEWHTTLDLADYARSVHAGGLLEEENDFRNLSVELRNDGAIAELTQYARLEAPLPKEIAPGDYRLAVFSSEGLPLMLGRISIGKS